MMERRPVEGVVYDVSNHLPDHDLLHIQVALIQTYWPPEPAAESKSVHNLIKVVGLFFCRHEFADLTMYVLRMTSLCVLERKAYAGGILRAVQRQRVEIISETMSAGSSSCFTRLTAV